MQLKCVDFIAKNINSRFVLSMNPFITALRLTIFYLHSESNLLLHQPLLLQGEGEMRMLCKYRHCS